MILQTASVRISRMDPGIVADIANDLALPESSVAATINLLEKGATVPFIEHYRKEISGLDGAKVRAVWARMVHYKEILDKRASLLKLLSDQGKLTEELRIKIEGCLAKAELDDLHHRFKIRKKSRGSEAMEKGLEPLAEYLWNQEPDAWSLEEHTDVFIDPEKKVASREEALQGASDIMAEWIAENVEYRKVLREMLWNEGSVVSTVVPAKVGQKTKYNMYYDRREAVTTIPSHRVLAIRRGSKEGILTSSIEGDQAKALEFLLSSVIREKDSLFAPVLERAVHDSYTRILRPLVETEVRAMLKERADRDAIRVFQENLANLLNSPPAGPMVVMGVDPGKGQECKLAVVDEKGKFLEESTISLAPPQNDDQGPRATLRDLLARHNVQAISIGSGMGSRELESVLRQALADEKIENVLIASVNDAGLAIYSSSRVAREEFPDLSIATRCAISLARRLQDPLSELVKIDPKLIGVGQYQHDVDQKELHRCLVQTVQSCVNQVGVDLNTASHSLLRYVSGLNDKLARKIIAIRAAQGPFASRDSFCKAVELDALSCQQVAGFVRIPSGENPLDRTAIHPEAYPTVEKMAASLEIGVADLIGNSERISSLVLENFATDSMGRPTLTDIREELLKPGRDPRRTFALPQFRSDVKEIADLTAGMTLEGIVTNVTNFGAFVDIGVRQDGLVHLSQMSNRFIRDPREAVKVGDVVQVKVLSVEAETKRIGLSMKALLPAVPRHRKKPRQRASRPSSRPAIKAPEAGAAVEATAPPAAQSAEAAAPAHAEALARGPREGNRPRHRRRRHTRPERPPQPQESVSPEEKPPEPTLQEKIAILQSKFRGIS